MKLPALPAVNPYWLAAGAAVAVLAYVALRGGSGASLGTRIGTGAVDIATDAAAGTIVGIGKVFGIPETNPTKCDAARKIAGNAWEVSKVCPAADFFAYMRKGWL